MRTTGWIPVPTSSLAFGPLYLTQRATALTPTLCLSLQPTTGKIFPFPLPSSSTLISDLDPEELEAIVENDDPASLGPQDVHHVWVCTRIQDTEDRVTFRSATGKYLAADEVGIVTAAREARGMQEEWTLEDSESAGSIVVKSAYGKYLSVDLIAGGKLELRADEEKEGDNERWSCWMQGEFLLKAKKAKVDRSGIQAERKVDGLVIVGSMAGAENEYMCVAPSHVLILRLTGKLDHIVKSTKLEAKADWSVPWKMCVS